MGLILLLASLLGSAAIVALSRHLSRSDDARDFAISSHIAIGEEP